MSAVATIADTVKDAASALHAHSESPRLDAELLLATLLGVSRTALIARGDEPLAASDGYSFAQLIRRRAGGMPVAYLTGRREFWSLPLEVTPAVLVPRPETEILVERALATMPADAGCTALDLGTGSGAIALSLAHERPHWSITGADISRAALEVARSNARLLGLPQIRWRQGSWFDAVAGERFQLIVSNPPYIAAADPALAALAAEPVMALSSGPSGLEALSAIIADAPRHLDAGGVLVLEHGVSQAQDVAQLLERHGFTSIQNHPDFSGRPRVALGIHTPN
ncbi:MAG TPA: peptide chain release factor N(5)-glutamine methyltransferase [Steroidobacteraceae bacterium]|jgi:release factor glutamine methyltransferase|nr:peptide chain release factor N(5)-glutamine methyltransferase [Steroidobacteraceae bacterium]